MATEPQPPATQTRATSSEASSLAPFRHPVFAVLWVATVVSNIGTWMQSAAAGWLMTNLRPVPFEVALAQAATTLPMFLFSLPAGALADIAAAVYCAAARPKGRAPFCSRP